MNMNKKINGNDGVAWILVALLAAIFVITKFVDESYESGALFVSFLVTLAALAFVGFQNRRDE